MRLSRAVLLVTVAGVAGFSATPALAQAEGAVARPAPPQTAEDDARSRGGGEIVVTATRTATDKQKVGVALTAITAEQLETLAPHTLLDLQGSAPNVFIGIGTAAPGQSAIYIRGQGYADVEKTQSPPVGLIQDGVFFGNNTGQLLDMFDVCSVEVDRGPQGIFYGKNTTAGLINITRCAPTRALGASLEAGYGSFKEGYVRGVLNAPLGSSGGLKVSANYHRTDGYYRNVFTGGRSGGSEYIALAAKLSYDLTSWLKVDLAYDRIHETGGGTPVQFGNVLTATILSGGNPAALWPRYNPKTGSPDGLKPRQVENRKGGDADVYNTRMYSGILTAQTPLGQLISQSSYIDEADAVKQDFDGTCVTAPGCTTVRNPLLGATGGFLQTLREQTYTQFTQETRLQGKALGQFDYLFGAFYYRHNIKLHQNTNKAIDQFSQERDHSWSYFGNIDWHPIDTITLSAGGRDISETKRFNSRYILLGSIPLTPPIGDKRSWHKFVTRFAAQWQAAPDVLLYASRAEGFRSGGFSIRGTLSERSGAQSNCGVMAGCPQNNFLSFKPETATTYEGGIKSRWFDRAVTFNANAFVNDVKDSQQNQVVVTPGYGPGTNTYIVNYPKVRIKGFEFELDLDFGRMTAGLEGLHFNATAGFQKATVRNGAVNGQQAAIGPNATAGAPGSIADFTGRKLGRVPEHNYSLRGSYEREIGSGVRLNLTTGYSYIDDFSLGNFGIVQDIQKGYGLVDASAGLSWDAGYFLRISGKNLTDKDYRSQSLPTVFFQGWGPGRSFMVSAGASF